MKNLKSVAVAVVLGYLLCSGGLAMAASSTTSGTVTITLTNSTGYNIKLKQGSTVLGTVGSNLTECYVGDTCTYQGDSGSTYTVEVVGASGEQDYESVLSSHNIGTLSVDTKVTCELSDAWTDTVSCSSAATN
jgi:hypothetical protein